MKYLSFLRTVGLAEFQFLIGSMKSYRRWKNMKLKEVSIPYRLNEIKDGWHSSYSEDRFQFLIGSMKS